MENKLDFRGVNIKIVDEGTGLPVLLLHGYLESSEIWKSLSDQLKDVFRIIRIDLPGHGESGLFHNIHTMEIMAETTRFVMDALFIDKCVLIGHSMGGYVTLAFAEHYPERLLGFVLFHSTPFADTEEKKRARDREIELIKQGKKNLIIDTNVPELFAGDNLGLYGRDLEKIKEIARRTPEEGIIAVLEGMKNRPGRTTIIKNSKIPFMVILGKKDNHIQFESIKSKLELNHPGELCILENSGHMGFIEEPGKSAEMIKSFVRRCSGK
ncbi:MAG: alpha/beta hydrolase [Bacteroidales bacterium]|nr:alpha/beta hydrolase [Bacteroidales bacterium]